MLAQVKSGALFGKRGPPPTLSFVGSATSNDSANVSAPGGIAAGDLAVLYDAAYDTGTPPTDVVPSGFAAIGTSQLGVSNRLRWTMSYKVLTGSETTITGMLGGTGNAKVLQVWRKSHGTWGTPQSIGNEVGVPATSKVVTVVAAPLVVMGAQVNDESNVLTITAGAANKAEAEATALGFLQAGSVIYNVGSSPANQTVDSSSGTMLAIGAFYFPAT